MRHFRHVSGSMACHYVRTRAGRDERVEVIAQSLGRRQKVATGESEPVQMHHHPGVRRLGDSR